MRIRAQSATEYLSTYSWAILAAAVVLTVLFSIGVFSRPIPIQSCLLVSGYVCTHPILTTEGILSFNLSYIGQTITVTGIGCNSGTLPPAALQSVNFILTSNRAHSVTVFCPIPSNAFGTAFEGHLWLQYNTQTQTGEVSDIGVILGAVNTRTSTSTTSTSTTSTTSTSSTSTSTTSSTSTSTTSTTTSTTTTTSSSTTISYIYCVGGWIGSYISNVYYASISAIGVGTWAPTTSYPLSSYRSPNGCTIYQGYIYCIGGVNGTLIPNSYYAPVSSAGIGSWSATTSYPIGINYQACVDYGGYTYCVAGMNQSAIAVSNSYYSAISSSGISTWRPTTSYPIAVLQPGCVQYSNYIYCVGGKADGGLSYYATLSSSGIGTWTSTTSFPFSLQLTTCVAYSNIIYCYDDAGPAHDGYYATLSSSGIGTWTLANAYPLSAYFYPCSQSGGYIYCVGGDNPNNQVYYSSLTSSGLSAWAPTTSYPLAVNRLSCPTLST